MLSLWTSSCVTLSRPVLHFFKGHKDPSHGFGGELFDFGILSVVITLSFVNSRLHVVLCEFAKIETSPLGLQLLASRSAAHLRHPVTRESSSAYHGLQYTRKWGARNSYCRSWKFGAYTCKYRRMHRRTVTHVNDCTVSACVATAGTSIDPDLQTERTVLR